MREVCEREREVFVCVCECEGERSVYDVCVRVTEREVCICVRSICVYLCEKGVYDVCVCVCVWHYFIFRVNMYLSYQRKLLVVRHFQRSFSLRTSNGKGLIY